MRRLWAGLAFLSRLPLPQPRERPFDAADLGKATLLFPLVGAILGALEAGALLAIGAKLPPLVGAMLLLALHALLTGALHLDGLADMADGFGGGRTREDVLRIMRDHHIGSYGVVALVLLLGFKAATLATLLATGHWRALVVAAALGRWSSVPLARFLPYARRGEGGLGAALTDHVGPAELVGSTALALALTLGLLGLHGLVPLAAAVGTTLFVGQFSHERIGGVTGDTLGAACELTEAAVYLLAVAFG
jgi:cobalamin 5'-phosphate synthase/cobalamin synthase